MREQECEATGHLPLVVCNTAAAFLHEEIPGKQAIRMKFLYAPDLAALGLLWGYILRCADAQDTEIC
jgi:hypothetical protein